MSITYSVNIANGTKPNPIAAYNPISVGQIEDADGGGRLSYGSTLFTVFEVTVAIADAAAFEELLDSDPSVGTWSEVEPSEDD